MKKQILHAILLLATVNILFSGCKKEIGAGNQTQDLKSIQDKILSKEQDSKLVKRYNATGVTAWMALQLKVIRTTLVTPSAINNSRYFAYNGIALYEAVVQGMPHYRSLYGQLNTMPSIPQIEHGKKYHWGAVANATLAYMNKNMLSFTNAANLQSMDSLENALNTVYQAEAGNEIFQRSVNYGKSVAQIVYNWSLTDGHSTIYPLYIAPVGPGLWEPTPPGFGSAATPFWGRNQLLVIGSLDNTAPPSFVSYSTDPTSAYYKQEKEVYDISQTLSASQIAQALYYRDNPGWPGGGHYVSILMQAIQIENSMLDKAAIAYAKVGIAINDCLIACWQAKYQYNIQRPISYIRTVLGYPLWNPLFGTPPHPDYPSGHSTAAGAAEVMLTNLFGPNFHLVNHAYDFLGMPPQTYSSFSDMAQQIGEARVFAGIHTRMACVEGREQGQKIARNILNKLNFFKGHDENNEEDDNEQE